MNLDPSLLRAALIGYENQLMQIEQAIAELRRQLNMTSPGQPTPAKARKRTMSAAAKRRIAAAQKKRWAAYRKAKKSK